MSDAGKELVRLSAFFAGDVQGVGFRMRTQMVAKGLAVSGWVKNLPDGRVEMAAEGARPELQRLLDGVLREMGDHIHDHNVQWRDPAGETGPFRIAY